MKTKDPGPGPKVMQGPDPGAGSAPFLGPGLGALEHTVGRIIEQLLVCSIDCQTS